LHARSDAFTCTGPLGSDLSAPPHPPAPSLPSPPAPAPALLPALLPAPALPGEGPPPSAGAEKLLEGRRWRGLLAVLGARGAAGGTSSCGSKSGRIASSTLRAPSAAGENGAPGWAWGEAWAWA
jgi:hypothetical protein